MNGQIQAAPVGYHIYINNRMRSEPFTDPFFFKIPDFQNPLPEGTYIGEVQQVLIRNYVYNIRANINDRFMITVGAMTTTYIIPAGFYSATDLITYFNARMSTAGLPLTMSLYTGASGASPTTQMNVLEITSSGGTALTFVRDTSDPITAYYYNAFDRFYATIGFLQQVAAGSLYFTTSASSVIGDGPLDLYGTSLVNINLSSNINTLQTDVNNYQTMISVPLQVEYGDLEIYHPTLPGKFQIESSQLVGADISVTDEWGEYVTGVPYNAELYIHVFLAPVIQSAPPQTGVVNTSKNDFPQAKRQHVSTGNIFEEVKPKTGIDSNPQYHYNLGYSAF